MNRKDILYKLHSYTPTKEETKFKKDMLNFIQENENCFERHLPKGHVTASSWLLNRDQGKALLMHQQCRFAD